MAVIDTIKRRAGFNTAAFDDDINALIAAARYDLAASGVPVEAIDMGGGRVDEAIICYALAHGWWDTADAQHYEAAYQRQVAKLSVTEAVL